VKTLYLICGVSGCGKSWATRQVADKFHYIPHDRCWVHPEHKSWDPKTAWAADMKDESRYLPGAKSNHLQVLVEASKIAKKPLITECPFAERNLRQELEAAGLKVVPIFVVEPPMVVAQRYFAREKKNIPQAALTRAESIRERALEWGSFHGTSDEVLKYLKSLPV
jgi:gluconate kinase